MASENGDAIAIFDRDTDTGGLTFLEELTGIAGLDRPRSIVISPDGASAYVACYDSNAVLVFDRNAADGTLALAQTYLDGEDGANLDHAVSVALSPNGLSVYALAYYGRAITRFDRDPATGALTMAQVLRDGYSGVDGLSYPWQLSVSPDGGAVYTATMGENCIGVFARDLATGQLSFTQEMSHGAGVNYGTAEPARPGGQPGQSSHLRGIEWFAYAGCVCSPVRSPGTVGPPNYPRGRRDPRGSRFRQLRHPVSGGDAFGPRTDGRSYAERDGFCHRQFRPARRHRGCYRRRPECRR